MLLKDVMKMTGLSKKAIQYYEDQGFLHPQKYENGYRKYDNTCVETLQKIQKLRQLGLHMKEIRAILIEGNYAPQVYEEVIHEIDRNIVVLQEQKKILRKRMKDEQAEMEVVKASRPYVFMDKPVALIGVLQGSAMLIALLLTPYLFYITDWYIVGILFAIALQMVEGASYEVKVLGIQDMEIGLRHVLLSEVVGVLKYTLIMLSFKTCAYLELHVWMVICVVVLLSMLWMSLHMVPDGIES